MNRTKPISGELLRLKDEIHQYAIDYGLDFHPVVFEVCDYDTINILAAQGGFPSRYPHWRFGMEYDQLSKSYAYGLSKIYEMVINTEPVYAYLLKANNLLDQKLVMAHVYGHADFFKNNLWFKSTDRSMMDVMANHGTKIRKYMDKYGQDKVEDFVDKVLSLENLLDINVLFEDNSGREKVPKDYKAMNEALREQEEGDRSQALRSFMRSKIKSDKKNITDEVSEELPIEAPLDMRPDHIAPRDIMKYLIEFAPLQEWEADILGCLRDEAYYFLPQRMTKIMNEGWASYWHSTILTQRALKSSEIIEFADKHSGVMAMSKQNINPYKIGIEMMRDIEYRWNTGRFGKEYNECTNMHDRENWHKDTGLGREKIFEVRKSHNDITFIDEFFTREFCERQQLFTYKYNPRSGRFEIDNRDFEAIKQKLLSSLTNFGSPVIEVESGNFNNRGELHLVHRHQGVDLDMQFAAETMRNIYNLWKRPINLSTTQEETQITFHFDGKEMKPLK
ncbi:SpoVR family protein [Bacteriovoracaceae bacterium]|nr:SpoVR family protein [Bacteriovoracaceae bacterium]